MFGPFGRRSGRLRSRLRPVGHGRLVGLERRRVDRRARASRSSSAARSSTRRSPTATARASNCSARSSRAIATRRSSSRRRSRRRTCSGRRSPSYALDDVFPADHIRRSTETSLTNLGLSSVDLQQFHVWTDAWADDDRWQRAVDDLKREGLIRAFGISVNRWEPANVLKALAHRPRRQRAGRLQHLRPESGGRAVPGVPRARRRRDRARAVRRGQPDRHDDARHDAGPRATGATSTSRRDKLAETLDRVDALQPDAAAGHDAAGAGAAVHPGQPGRHDRDPGHAPASARGGEPGASRTAGRCRRTCWRGCGGTAGSRTYVVV